MAALDGLMAPGNLAGEVALKTHTRSRYNEGARRELFQPCRATLAYLNRGGGLLTGPAASLLHEV
jgi:hypothetical protein